MVDSLFIDTDCYTPMGKLNRRDKATPEDSMRKAYIDGKWIPIKPTKLVRDGRTKGLMMGVVKGEYVPYKKVGPVKIPE